MKKILIVEDDPIVATVYRNKFAHEGYQVEVAADGEAGWTAIREFRPDAVLLDLMLPKLTGVELMRQIRAEPGFAQTPLIVFSNTYLTSMVQAAWKAGATKCLSKTNCTPKQLLAVLRKTLGESDTPLVAPAAEGPGKTAGAALMELAGRRPPGQGASAPAGDAEAAFQAELRQSFVAGLPAMLTSLRAALQGLIKADNEKARLASAEDMYRRIHALTGNAGLSGLAPIVQMSDPFEALLKALCEKPRNINASTLRTVASAVDCLGQIFQQDLGPEPQERPPAQALVVDDEAISRRAVAYALTKAKLKAVSVEDPKVAYGLLAENKFDLVFLDVDMPGMTGYELCSKLRALPAHKHTPVVFVTSLNDFKSRANSTMSGGNDFIAKPFLMTELAVKALVHIARRQLAARSGP